MEVRYSTTHGGSFQTCLTINVVRIYGEILSKELGFQEAESTWDSRKENECKSESERCLFRLQPPLRGIVLHVCIMYFPQKYAL